MQRDSKLGYGFLLVGAGVPYLIDKALGLPAAIIVSVACVVFGGAFLLAGAKHKEGELRPRKKIWEWLIIVAALGTLVYLGSNGIFRIMPKKESVRSEEPPKTESKPEPPASISTKPETHTPPKAHEKTEITVEIGKSLNPKSALETRFILTNRNPFPITGVSYVCDIHEGEGNVRMVHSMTGQAEDLPSGYSRSLSCDMIAGNFFVDQMNAPVLNLWVSYVYKNREEKTGFRFWTKRSRDGTFEWFPGGEAENPPKKVVQPIKAPLEIVEFRSDYGISIANNGPLSVHVVSLLVKGHVEIKSIALGLDIAPGKISEQKIHEEGLHHVRTLRKLADTWEDHVKKARELYLVCGMQWTFFSPSDVSLQQIKDNYTRQNQSLGYKDISGILYYRVQGLNKTEEQVVPIVETITINNDTCPKL
jgi:hypothetical protein